MTTTRRPAAHTSRVCLDCGRKLTTANRCHVSLGVEDLCNACFDAAGLENEHQDGYHTDGPVDGCPMCGTYTAPAQKLTGAINTVAKSHTSHAGHNHPRTPAGRAACRKANGR